MKKNGYFQLFIEESGTFLKLIPPKEGGKRVILEDVIKYLKFKKITDYNLGRLENFLKTAKEEETMFKLMSERRLPEDESVILNIDPQGETAYGRFYPPSNDGNLMGKDDIVRELVQAKVKFGLKEDVLDEFLKNREYCKDILLAEALAPVEGKDAVLTYHFNTSNVSKPKVNEDGSVDFHQLGNIQGIRKGDLLVSLVPADLGKPGMTIFGKVLKPKKVVNKVLRSGKNYTVSEDGCSIHSDVSGHVTLVDGNLIVSDIYEVVADVDASTGDIDYEGNVEIKGNVLTGFSIEATGNIIVNGVVEGAKLVAGGEIVLKRGIQGMYRGSLKAEGNIVTKFIENSEVISGGDIVTDAIMHSNVRAKGSITVVGKRGMISGGNVVSGSTITAKKAGSHMGTVTVLEVGADPKVLERYKELEQEIEAYQSDEEKINQMLTLFNNKMLRGEKLPPEQMQYFRKLNKSLMLINKKHYAAKGEHESITDQLNSYKSGGVRIEGSIFPGVKIVIAGSVYHVNEELYRGSFIREAGEVYMRQI